VAGERQERHDVSMPRCHPRTAAALLSALVGALGVTLGGCAPAPVAGSLPPTLTILDPDGAAVAMQSGIPVPTFDAQPRRVVSLDGAWRVEPADLDTAASLTDRGVALDRILAEAAGREGPAYPDAGWQTTVVPGAINPPPERTEGSGWFRRTFRVPSRWDGMAATLKMGGVNYLADVWVNGTWVGYHEGGYTPFAFDVSAQLVAGSVNTIAVRVDNPAWGSRNDIVPWGLADWWNYGGITRSAWIEATPPLSVARADVVPHLDGVDVSAVVAAARTVIGAGSEGDAEDESPSADPGTSGVAPSIRFRVYPAEVTPENVASSLATALVPARAEPLVSKDVELAAVTPELPTVADASFLMGGPDLWSPEHPALYVLEARLVIDGTEGDAVWSTFGLRRATVDPASGQLLLNGKPRMFTGVGLQDEALEPPGTDRTAGGHRVTAASEALAQLDRAAAVDATLLRTGHTPANPLVLRLADRLGFAVWEEIPLYHYTPLTFGIALDRGIAVQMLREMALRDMNRPSVLFHGLANESTGTDERRQALQVLHDVDRAIDGTRLTGQAAYGFGPDDPTHAPLDVAGFTFYHGVFYGTDAAAGTAAALATAHATNPDKPIMALEFGRWSDDRNGTQRQLEVFDDTFAELSRHSAANPNGYVGAAVWWTLQDYATEAPGIGIEHFGLYDATGQLRPAGEAAVLGFAGSAGAGDEQQIESGVRSAAPAAESPAPPPLLLYLAYAFGVVVAVLGIGLVLLTRGPGRSSGRRRRRTAT
jgi:beta-glucuronidase